MARRDQPRSKAPGADSGPPPAPPRVTQAPVIHTDARFAQAVEQAVTRLEAHTDAELVVVAAPQSGSYRDIPLLAALIGAWAFLLLAVLSPWSFSALWLPLDCLLVALLLGTVIAKAPTLLRLLTRAERRDTQVLRAAQVAFLEEQVHGTRGRTGVLIYVSALEQRVELLPDHGVDACIPHGEWHALSWDASTLDGFLSSLDACGAVLAEHLPALDGDNPDEMPNAPRIRT